MTRRAAKPNPSAAAGGETQNSALASRRAAVGLIASVLRERTTLNETFDLGNDGKGAAAALRGLDARDRAFARLIAATTLRRLGQIDAILGHCLERPLPNKAAFIQDVLRAGVAQVLFIGTPAHAAVDSSVRLAGDQPGNFKGLVNGVLRRIVREAEALRAAHDAPALNVPDWLWQAWCHAYGETTATAIAKMHVAEPPLDLTLKDEASAHAWTEKLDARILPMGSLRRNAGGRIEDLPGFVEGAWWVQDAAAALPAKILISALTGGGGRSREVLDLCAAPGGKTAQFAAAGLQTTAVDISEARLERVRANLKRLGLSATLVAADAASFKPDRQFSAVLVDAPCSSTGTLRRRPDVAHLKRKEDLAALTRLQRRLLDAAFDQLESGGVLVYAVCSLQPEESEHQIEAFLEAHAGELERLAIAPHEIGGLSECVSAAGDLRTLPCHLAEDGGLDGFYAARLIKTA